MAKKTSRAKKVWIFKWLAKKHRCNVRLVRDFTVDGSKKNEFAKIILDREDGISFMLMARIKPSSSSIHPKIAAVEVPIPSWDIFSYADVLAGVLETMEKNESDCWLVDVWSRRYIGLFLKRGTTLEELEIAFDLTWQDVFNKRA